MNRTTHTALMVMTASPDWSFGLDRLLDLRRAEIRKELEGCNDEKRIFRLQGMLLELTELEGLRRRLESVKPD